MADSTEQATPSLMVKVDVMLVEAGMMANGLAPFGSSKDFAERLYNEQESALSAGKASLTVAMSPFEAGLAMQGLAQAQSTICDDLLGRIQRAVIQLIKDNGIEALPTDNLGGVIIDDSEGDLSSDPAPSEQPSQPEDLSSEAQPSSMDDDEPTTVDATPAATQAEQSSAAPEQQGLPEDADSSPEDGEQPVVESDSDLSSEN